MKTPKFFSSFLFPLLFTVRAALAGTLDQQYLPSQNGGLIIEQSQTIGQTFQVGLSGLLNEVDVDIAGHPIAPPQGLTLEIHPTLSDGSPATSVLASISIPGSAVPTSFQFVAFDLSAFGLSVATGESLAIVLRSDAGYQAPGGGIDPYAWRYDTSGGYAPGSGYISSGSSFNKMTGVDLGFKTYVDTTSVPEPSITTTFFLGSGIALLFRRIRGPLGT
jgi:hypothetical protein